jgi:hypothetical protein
LYPARSVRGVPFAFVVGGVHDKVALPAKEKEAERRTDTITMINVAVIFNMFLMARPPIEIFVFIKAN